VDSQVYKFLHLIGVVLLFLALGGAVLRARLGAAVGETGRRLVAITHGVALVVLLVAGFGSLAKLGFHFPFPAWVWIKIVIWLLMGGVVVFLRARPQSANAWWWRIALLGALAAYLGVYKPF
jgi:hypothetical protein